MSPALEQILQSVKALPVDDQRALVDAIQAQWSNGSPKLTEEQWAEIRRRSAELDAGRMERIPWSVVRQQAREAEQTNG